MSVTAVNERLQALTAAGTSVWLDQIRRSMTEGGELARMVEEESLRGVTSNPAIFEKAILGSADYDGDIREGVDEGLEPEAIYERIAVRDVQLACDVLRPVYDSSGGADGFVSLEVSPALAHDTQGTIDQALDFWGRVDRPNLMIKVPGTDEGLPAIEELLVRGLHVNVTLLFAVSQYEKVMETFIRAMERRQEAGEPLDRHSVASFFVSRVDTEVDKRLDAAGDTDLLGRAGLANARAAYQAYKRVFKGERFAALREAGCPVQRPLWASTGVKNPAYSETMYVYGLVAPETVNTMPLNTLQAAARDGEVTGATADQDPSEDLQALADAGIDLDDVTDKLLREGIEAFVKPFDKLLAGIETKRDQIVTGRPEAVEADLPGELREAIVERLRKGQEERVAARIWHRDGTLWAPEGTPELVDRLGWLSITERMSEEAGQLKAFAAELAGEGLTDAVLLGMGGSSLAPEVFRQVFGVAEGALRLHVLDSTDPGQVLAIERAVDPAKTLFVLSTKSGGTIETLSLFHHFWAVQGDGRHWVAITDPGSTLLDLAKEHGFRRWFCNDPDIGGRYSALSYFGLVPAALTGVDVEEVLESGQVAMQTCETVHEPEGNSGLWLGLVLGELALRGRDKLTLVVDGPYASFGLWAEQLVAESTGKQGKGILPIADEPLVEAEAYGRDRVFVHIVNPEAPDDGNASAIKALVDAGHPVITVQVQQKTDIGRLFFMAEFATAVAGWVLGINPFDQPNVQEAKDNTKRVLQEGAGEIAEGDLSEIALEPPQYLAILGYLPYSDEVDAAVGRLRAAVVRRFGVATTWGYGPRYLHSTGQLHKGGPASGVFLELVHDGTERADVPGQPFDFGTLVRAQADGDLQTLRDHGRVAVRVTLPAGDLAGGIDRVTEQLTGGSV